MHSLNQTVNLTLIGIRHNTTKLIATNTIAFAMLFKNILYNLRRLNNIIISGTMSMLIITLFLNCSDQMSQSWYPLYLVHFSHNNCMHFDYKDLS